MGSSGPIPGRRSKRSAPPRRQASEEVYRPHRPRRKPVSARRRRTLSDDEAKRVLDGAVETWRAWWLSPRRVKWDIPERLEALAEAYQKRVAALREGNAAAIQKAETEVERARELVRELAGLAVTLDYSGLAPEVQRKLGVPQSPEEELQRLDEAAKGDRERLDALLRETRAILLSLTRTGANPAYILSVLIRYAGKRTTEFPGPLTILIRGKLTDYTLEAERWLPLVEGAPARVTFKKGRRISRRKKPRKPGPAELAVSAGMALLHRHFLRTTGRPHAKEIGILFTTWDVGRRTNEVALGARVYRRVQRLRDKYPQKFGRLIRYEKTLFRALTGTNLAL